MIERLLPAWVATAEAYDDAAESSLFPEEEAAIARAVPRRRAEFATGRACARAALAALGLPASPILPGPDRAPIWPTGVVGSITHCRGYRAAAVARSTEAASVGIDAEPNEPVPDRVLTMAARPEERAWLDEFAVRWPDVHWDRLLFSAKEAVYKAWYPMAQRWLGFDDATVEPDTERGTLYSALAHCGACARRPRAHRVQEQLCDLRRAGRHGGLGSHRRRLDRGARSNAASAAMTGLTPLA